MEFDMTALIEMLLSALALLVSTYLIPWLKSKKNAQQLNELNQWVRIAVTAAEQLFRGSDQGEAKKEFVVRWLNARNIKFDTEKIDAMIEAAVYDLKINGLIGISGETLSTEQE